MVMSMMKNDLLDKLERCKNIDIMSVKDDEIDNIDDIQVDGTKSSKERIVAFLEKAKNPYIFKSGNCIVKTEFANGSGIYADNCVTQIFKDIYK